MTIANAADPASNDSNRYADRWLAGLISRFSSLFSSDRISRALAEHGADDLPGHLDRWQFQAAAKEPHKLTESDSANRGKIKSTIHISVRIFRSYDTTISSNPTFLNVDLLVGDRL